MQVTTRSDRSAATALIHFFIRPFAAHLTKIKKIYDAGSPQLTPPKSAHKRCFIEERKVEDIWVYDITPKNGSKKDAGKKTKRIYYFAGGSWQTPPTGEHFDLLSTLAHRLSQPTIITLVSCPLAPNSPAKDTFPQLVALYTALSEHPDFGNEEVCFAGDSSGGNIVLALTMHCLSMESKPAARAPHSLLLICPTVDLLHEDPRIKEVEKHDPIESLDLVTKSANAWAGDWDKSDPRLSPVYATLSVLKEHDVRVNGIIAGYDVLSCEAETFVEHCKEAGIKGRFLIWERQMHVFPLTQAYNIPEAKEAVEWIIKALEEVSLSSDPATDDPLLATSTPSEGRNMHEGKNGHRYFGRMSLPSKSKNASGGRHGHRYFGRDERQIQTTDGKESIGEDGKVGRGDDALERDAGHLRSHEIMHAAQTSPKGHRQLV